MTSALDLKENSQPVRLTGADEQHIAEVFEDVNGFKRVRAEVVFPSGNVIPTVGTDLKYEEMNATFGGVARNTNIGSTFTTIYEQTGEGILIGFLITLESITASEWFIKLEVDNTLVFELSIIDLIDKDIFGFDEDTTKNIPEWLGIDIRDNTFRYEGPNDLPLSYNNNIKIQIRKTNGDKRFRAGLLSRTDVS